MNPAAASPSVSDYAAFAAELQATGILSDPWLEGRPRFRPQPVMLSAETHRELRHAAETVGALYQLLCDLVAADPALADRFFDLTPWQRLMWEASAPAWHGIARADLFLTREGVQSCELNCDTPSGEAEAVLLGAWGRRAFPGPARVDPNRGLERALGDLVAALARRLERDGRAGAPLSIGLVYPTELTEDLSMILLYRQWFEARGWQVTLGSPYNLGPAPRGGVALFDTPCDVLVRHYKTDWWGERLAARDDEGEYVDPAPLAGPLSLLLRATLAGRCAVVNPFGAVLPQNKRAMALLWEEIDRFPTWAQRAIRAHIPYTARLELLSPEGLLADRDDWVLKSDYGCEGTEVLVGRECPLELWEAALRHARPRRWVAQRAFAPIADPSGAQVNYGVYLVAGRAVGIFTRLSEGATDRHALSAPTLCGASGEPEGGPG